MSSLLRLERQQERFLKIHFEFDLYLFSDQNGAKTVPFWGGTNLYGLYKGLPPGFICSFVTGQEDFPSNYLLVYFV